MVTHLSTNQARRRLTSLIETNTLPLSQTTTIQYKNVGRSSFRFVTIHAFDRETGGQTDGSATAKTVLHRLQHSNNTNSNNNNEITDTMQHNSPVSSPPCTDVELPLWRAFTTLGRRPPKSLFFGAAAGMPSRLSANWPGRFRL